MSENLDDPVFDQYKDPAGEWDPELIAMLSIIPLRPNVIWVRSDLFQDKTAFEYWLHLSGYSTYELVTEMAYCGEKTGDVIIRGIQ